METNKKRTYTVPVLFIIIVALSILCILFYSKNLLAEQNEKSEAGQRLSEKYVFAQSYAKLLQEGSAQMSDAKTEVDRLQAKEKLGEARFASMEAVSLIGEALRIQDELSDMQQQSAIDKLQKTLGSTETPLYTVGEHEGPLTEAEIAMLSSVKEAASKSEEALKKYLAPSGVAGYRIMADGGEWIDAVLEAEISFDAIAETLSKPILNP